MTDEQPWVDDGRDHGWVDEIGAQRERIGLSRSLDWDDLERRCAEAAAAGRDRARHEGS